MNARRWTPSSRLLVSALIIVGILIAAPGPASDAHGDRDAAGAVLARTSTDYLTDLQPLDPQTLADDGNQLPAQGDEHFLPGTMMTSKDGKTVAGISPINEIIVEDAATRTVRARIDPHGSVFLTALSQDGSKIIASVDVDYSTANLQPPSWKLFDVATGSVSATIQGNGDWGSVQIDPVSWRMYQLQVSDPSSAPTQTHPAKLTVFDLNTGHVAGQTDLPDVQMGSWTDESRGDKATGEPLFVEFSPGIAISPDGRQIAIVHATDDGITMVDAATLTVERTLTMHAKTSLLDRFFASLPLAPRTASAKMAELTDTHAVYTADGRQLLVYGDDSQIKDDGPVYHGRGISLVDVKDGTIEAHALDGIALDQIVALPGDNGLYLAGTVWKDYSPTESAPYMIAHLDLDTLNVLASRELPTYVLLVVLPSPQL
ncbi:MAG: hypothetical protein ACJ789_05420 [Thermomicrobiales bacterium]